jgi:hypothetical protein
MRAKRKGDLNGGLQYRGASRTDQRISLRQPVVRNKQRRHGVILTSTKHLWWFLYNTSYINNHLRRLQCAVSTVSDVTIHEPTNAPPAPTRRDASGVRIRARVGTSRGPGRLTQSLSASTTKDTQTRNITRPQRREIAPVVAQRATTGAAPKSGDFGIIPADQPASERLSGGSMETPGQL